MKQIMVALKSLVITCILTSFTYAQQPFYVGGSIGQSYVEEKNVVGGEDFDEEDFGFKVFGGYRFHQNIAAEIDYLDFGEPDDNILGADSEIDLYALALYGVGILPISDSFELFAKLGFAYWDADAKVEFMGASASDDEDGTDLAYGFGGSYAFSNQFAVRVEYEGVDVDDLDGADLLTVGGEVRF